MKTYGPLFRLEVSHDYYRAAPPLSIEPDPDTKQLMQRAGLHQRDDKGRIEVFADNDRELLSDIAQGRPLAFVYRLRAEDPTVQLITKGLAASGQRLFVVKDNTPLENRDAVPLDLIEDVKKNPLLAPSDEIRPPLAYIQITISPDAKDAVYSARFAADSRVWVYNIIGGEEDAKYQIRDTNDNVTFDAIEPRQMANGKLAKRFSSKDPIEMNSEPTQRFELLDDGPFGKRVILPVLPAAAPGSGSLDPAGTGLMSDIYINVT